MEKKQVVSLSTTHTAPKYYKRPLTFKQTGRSARKVPQLAFRKGSGASCTTPSTSALLGLPPGVRNRIWRYTIPERTFVTKQEPIVRLDFITEVCRQTLIETLGIFMMQTIVTIRVINCDGNFERNTNMTIAHLVVLAHNLDIGFPNGMMPSMSVEYVLGGRRKDWFQLKSWARAIHSTPLQHSLAKRSPLLCGNDYADIVISVICTAAKLQSLP